MEGSNKGFGGDRYVTIIELEELLYNSVPTFSGRVKLEDEADEF